MNEINNDNILEYLDKNYINYNNRKDKNLELIIEDYSAINLILEHTIKSINLKNITTNRNNYDNDRYTMYISSTLYNKFDLESIKIKDSNISHLALLTASKNIKEVILENVNLTLLSFKSKKLKQLELKNTNLKEIYLPRSLLNKKSLKNIIKHVDNLDKLNIRNMSTIRYFPEYKLENKNKINNNDYLNFSFFKKEKGFICFSNNKRISLYDNALPNNVIEKYFDFIGSNPLMKDIFFHDKILPENEHLIEKIINDKDQTGNRLSTYCKSTKSLKFIFEKGYKPINEDIKYLANEKLKKIYENYLLKDQINNKFKHNKKQKIKP